MKIIQSTLEQATRLAEDSYALTVGNFDGVHLGHQALLSELKKAAFARRLKTCVVTFEPLPRAFFSPSSAPAVLTNLSEKKERLALAGIDLMLVLTFDTALAELMPDDFLNRLLYQALSTRYVLIGHDFRFGARRQGDFTQLAAYGEANDIEVEEFAPFMVDNIRVSSSEIRRLLERADFGKASAMLGYDYQMSGEVVAGKKLGRTLDVPTANVALGRSKAAVDGVFVVEVLLESSGRRYPAVASVGARPSVEDSSPILEAHLLDQSVDLYGEYIRVKFCQRLRAIKRFETLEELAVAMRDDVAAAKRWWSSEDKVRLNSK